MVKDTARIYVRVMDESDNFKMAFWPTRKVVVKGSKTTIHYHASKQMTFDNATHVIEQEAYMWHGPLDGSGIPE